MNDGIESLIRDLNDQDAEIRAHACVSLRELGDKRAVDSLIMALEDRHEYVARYAAEALGTLGDERAIRSLEKAKENRSRIMVSIYAGEAINAIKKRLSSEEEIKQ